MENTINGGSGGQSPPEADELFTKKTA